MTDRVARLDAMFQSAGGLPLSEEERRVLERLPERLGEWMERLGCYGCGRPYEMGPDLLIEQSAWLQIAPDPSGGGVLCPNCIHDRLVAAGFADCSVLAEFKSGPMASDELITDLKRDCRLSRADELARLTAENRRLREALEPFAHVGRFVDETADDYDPSRGMTSFNLTCGHFARARAALAPHQEEEG